MNMFDQLPKDILKNIFNTLDSRSLDSVSATCTRYKNMIYQEPALFKNKGLKSKICNIPFRFIACQKKLTSSNRELNQKIHAIVSLLRNLNFESATIDNFLPNSILKRTSLNAKKILSEISSKGLIILFLIKEGLEAQNVGFTKCIQQMVNLLLIAMSPADKKTYFNHLASLQSVNEETKKLSVYTQIYNYATPPAQDYDNYPNIEKSSPSFCSIV